jgi:hypothetical protein
MSTAVWAAHDWILGDEPLPDPQKVNEPNHDLNPQACDMTIEGYDDWAQRKFEEILNS